MKVSIGRQSHPSTIAIELQYDATKKRWLGIKRFDRTAGQPFVIRLLHGGEVTVYPSMLDEDERQSLWKELTANSHYFRQYKVQGSNEPRAHFLLHKQATEQWEDKQPGYRYGVTTMKSKPLNAEQFPALNCIARWLKKICRVPDWNIGINPVYYRDGNDHIGFHADNDQGEEKIMSVLVQSPPKDRKVEIWPKESKTKKRGKNGKRSISHGDKRIQLFLRAGDGYDMNGEMQKHYVHGVPKDKSQVGTEQMNRSVIVFRHGREKQYLKDSGTLANLEPRDCTVSANFGRSIDGLEEGSLYSRQQLLDMKAHR